MLGKIERVPTSAGFGGATLKSSWGSSDIHRIVSERDLGQDGRRSDRLERHPRRRGMLLFVVSLLVGSLIVMSASTAGARYVEPPTTLHKLVGSRSVQVEAKQFRAGRFVVLSVRNRTDSVLRFRVPFGTGLKVQEESVSQIFVLEESEWQLVPRGFLVLLFPSTVLDLPISGLDSQAKAWEIHFHHGVGKVLRFVDVNWSQIGHAPDASYGVVKRDKYDLSRLVLWFIRSVDASQILDSWTALGDSRREAEELLERHVSFAERVLKVYLLSRSK